MNERSCRVATPLLALVLALAACSDDGDTAGEMDAGADAAPAVAGGNGGGGPEAGGPEAGGVASGGSGSGSTPPSPMTPPAAVTCGDLRCTVDPQTTMTGVGACCTADDTCGVTTPIDPTLCLPPDQPGGPDLSCPEFVVPGFVTWGGCCTPDGQCGALDTSNLGCIPNADLGQPERSCAPDPDSTCERLVEVRCDGAEDCAGDSVCCGQFLDGYRRFVCRDDCQAAEVDEGGIWSNICHPGDSCTVAGYSCRANTDFLPDFLYRCRDTGVEAQVAGSTAAGEINCGRQVCGSGQKCCLSIPGVPRCVPQGEGCSCYVPEPSGNDGGVDEADAG